MTPADPAIATERLTKRFRGGQVAVDSLDLVVPSGSVYGFLGPNGSGKTTTIRMLLGLISPTAGSHQLLGQPMPKNTNRVLHRVGALIEGPAFHLQLSGRDNLRRMDALDRTADPSTAKARIDGVLDRVGLAAAARKKYRAYSLGMRQRLGIAAALLQPRDLLILDEPTNGLDPQGTREIRRLIAELAGDGITVLLSTHLLSEVEQICSHVGVMRTGKLISSGTLAELRSGSQRRVQVITSDPTAVADALTAYGLKEVIISADRVGADLEVDHERRSESELLRSLVLAELPISGFGVETEALEDVFVHLTGEGFDVSA